LFLVVLGFELRALPFEPHLQSSLLFYLLQINSRFLWLASSPSHLCPQALGRFSMPKSGLEHLSLAFRVF
jgi:hypothetical protein